MTTTAAASRGRRSLPSVTSWLGCVSERGAVCCVVWRGAGLRGHGVTGVQVSLSYGLLITRCGVADPPHLVYGTLVKLKSVNIG